MQVLNATNAPGCCGQGLNAMNARGQGVNAMDYDYDCDCDCDCDYDYSNLRRCGSMHWGLCFWSSCRSCSCRVGSMETIPVASAVFFQASRSARATWSKGGLTMTMALQ